MVLGGEHELLESPARSQAAVKLVDMKRLTTFALLALLSPAWLRAQTVPPTVTPPAEQVSAQQSIGVLIGLDRLYDSEIPRSEIAPTLEDKKSAANDRQWSENKDGAAAKPVHFDTTPEESPYATVWLQWTPAGPRIQVLRDIVLPRKDGFWRFGINHSSVQGPDFNDEDFFWLAPLGVKPALTHADSLPSGAMASTRRLTYIGPDFFSYRELSQGWGGTYGEGESAFVRSLDEFAKGPLKDADYDYDHPGLSLARVIGPGVESEFKKITAEVAPKESEETESTTPAAGDDADPCAGSGYRTSETEWYLVHRQGGWVALIGLQNSDPGICSRQTEWKPLSYRVTSTLAGRNPIPLPWAQVEKAFPGARHAFASPKGDWLVVITRTQIYLAALSDNSIGKPAFTTRIPYGVPVMAQWSLGKYVNLWDQQLSKLPPPNDNVFFSAEPLN